MHQPTSFRSAFDKPFSPELARAMAPGSILGHHRPTFGGARMEEPDAAAKAAADKAAADKAAADKAAADAAAAAADKGFPIDTPVAEMTTEQQAAYWKDKARKHEGTAKARQDYDAVVAERDRLKAANQTEAEKAADLARKEGEQTAATKYQGRLVQAELKAALKGKLPDDQLADHVEFIDASKFLTADGEVDADKVQKYATSLPAGGGKNWPDTGGGHRSGDDKKTKAEAGRAEAAKRFPKKDD